MTISEYIEAKLKVMYIGVSDVQPFLIAMGLEPLDELTDRNEVDIVFVRFIFSLLIRPDISEDSYSIKFDRKYITAWIKSESGRLGIDDLDFGDRVKDISYLA